jgi:hypothetical protein
VPHGKPKADTVRRVITDLTFVSVGKLANTLTSIQDKEVYLMVSKKKEKLDPRRNIQGGTETMKDSRMTKWQKFESPQGKMRTHIIMEFECFEAYEEGIEEIREVVDTWGKVKSEHTDMEVKDENK